MHDKDRKEFRGYRNDHGKRRRIGRIEEAKTRCQEAGEMDTDLELNCDH